MFIGCEDSMLSVKADKRTDSTIDLDTPFLTSSPVNQSVMSSPCNLSWDYNHVSVNFSSTLIEKPPSEFTHAKTPISSIEMPTYNPTTPITSTLVMSYFTPNRTAIPESET